MNPTHHEISKLEQSVRRLHHSEEWKTVLDQFVSYCNTHLEKMENLPAYVTLEDPGKEVDELSITEEGHDISMVLNILEKGVTHPGLNPASGGHLGYIPGGGIPTSGIGDYVAAITNKYAGVFYGSPGAVRVENFLIRWMCDILGYDSNAFGNLTSGGSIANMMAIICARDAHKMIGAKAETGVIYLTTQVHHCVIKSINMAGLECAHVRRIPVDDNFKMDINALKSQIAADVDDGLKPFLLIGSAGTTDTGVIDPLYEMAEIATKHNMWYHVDAAYGGFFLLVDELKEKFNGIHRADSVVLDPHKGLFLPYGSGAILVKDKERLKHSFRYQANYMQDADEFAHIISPSDVSPELTKHFRGLRMWLPLQIHGIAPFKEGLKEKALLTRYFYKEIENLGFETGPYPELSVMMYRFVPPKGDSNKFNALLVKMVKDDGEVFISSTTVNDIYYLRIAVLSFRTHMKTIKTLLLKLETFRDELLANNSEFC